MKENKEITALRKRKFDAYVNKIFNLCVKELGQSKFQEGLPDLILNYDEDDIMGGYYDHDLNELQINYQGFDDSQYNVLSIMLS